MVCINVHFGGLNWKLKRVWKENRDLNKDSNEGWFFSLNVGFADVRWVECAWKILGKLMGSPQKYWNCMKGCLDLRPKGTELAWFPCPQWIEDSRTVLGAMLKKDGGQRI